MAQPQMMQIKLSRFDAQPWGFRLQGGTDFAQPLLVQKVSELISFFRNILKRRIDFFLRGYVNVFAMFIEFNTGLHRELHLIFFSMQFKLFYIATWPFG